MSILKVTGEKEGFLHLSLALLGPARHSGCVDMDANDYLHFQRVIFAPNTFHVTESQT